MATRSRSRRELWLDRSLQQWRAAGLERHLSLSAGDPELDFSSNDYLGLSRHPRVVEAAIAAIEEYGAGAGAARLLGGGCPLDERVERRIASWLDADAALLFPTGFQANLGLLTALTGPGDWVFSDALNHASIIDACRLSRAEVGVYRHVDCDDLRRQLAAVDGPGRRFVVTESVFSMDGDLAPLADVADLCLRFDAQMIVDEAHAVGVLGEASGSGAWADADGDPEALIARVITGGKALGAAGGLVVGSSLLRQFLLNRARSFVFTTGVAPAISGALLMAVDIASRAQEARRKIRYFGRRIAQALSLPPPAAGVIPMILGDTSVALSIAEELRLLGLRVSAVRPPTVPEGTSRLRLAVHAHNSDRSVALLVETCARTAACAESSVLA